MNHQKTKRWTKSHWTCYSIENRFQIKMSFDTLVYREVERISLTTVYVVKKIVNKNIGWQKYMERDSSDQHVCNQLIMKTNFWNLIFLIFEHTIRIVLRPLPDTYWPIEITSPKKIDKITTTIRHFWISTKSVEKWFVNSIIISSEQF